MIHTLCGSDVLQKERHHIRHKGFNWIVDEYTGILEGLIVAEVELSEISTTVPLPDWVGREVTAEPTFKKINMLRIRQKAIEAETRSLRRSV
jgi:adenylate cyclase